MKWLMDFYHEPRRILRQYSIEAPLPSEAARLGWMALLADDRASPRRRRRPLFERAQRVEGRHESGWILYRIMKDGTRESPGLGEAAAA